MVGPGLSGERISVESLFHLIKEIDQIVLLIGACNSAP